MQRLDIRRAGLALGRGGEELQRPLQELGLPLRDLVGVDVELLRELGKGSIPFQGGQGHLGLERGRVIPSRPFHGLLSLWDGDASRPVEQSFHLTACPIFRGRL